MNIVRELAARVIAKIADGNIAAAKILVQLIDKDPDQAGFICSKLVETKSNPSTLWLIYKDECGQDIDLTMKMLTRWWNSGKKESLGQWIVDQNLKSAPEAQYYMNQEQPHA